MKRGVQEKGGQEPMTPPLDTPMVTYRYICFLFIFTPNLSYLLDQIKTSDLTNYRKQTIFIVIIHESLIYNNVSLNHVYIIK